MEDNNRIIKTEYSELMQKSYIDYAMSVIVARALPDVRDGLKPVQRRVLYDMYELGIRYDRPYRKSARIVGDTMGKYHPHGDSSIYEALVVMAQEFKKGQPLIDGHGNFGNIEGDGAAAMRYTEARLEKLTQEIRVYWPGFEGFVTVYYEGIFSCYEEGNRGVSGINRALIDFYWKGGIIAPAFRRETLSMQNPLFEKCTIYDGGARRYEIHEHIEEVLEFWNGILERADSIDKQALLEEKLGHPLPISYEDWLKDCHYEKLDKKTTRWLYQQERGFVEGMRDVSLKEIARQRIDEFTTTLRKYIL